MNNAEVIKMSVFFKKKKKVPKLDVYLITASVPYCWSSLAPQQLSPVSTEFQITKSLPTHLALQGLPAVVGYQQFL